MRRRTLLRSAAATATIGGTGATAASGSRDGQETTTEGQTTTTAGGGQTTTAAGEEFSITAPAWENGRRIPIRFTCEGQNISPRLTISNPPEGTRAFALVMADPDAPDPPFVHWLLWNIPADAREIPANVPKTGTIDDLGGAVQGSNGTGELGYIGPCPPRGDDRHTYLFTLYALESPLDLEPGAEYRRVVDAAVSNAIARARYVGQYERPAETTTEGTGATTGATTTGTTETTE